MSIRDKIKEWVNDCEKYINDLKIENPYNVDNIVKVIKEVLND